MLQLADVGLILAGMAIGAAVVLLAIILHH